MKKRESCEELCVRLRYETGLSTFAHALLHCRNPGESLGMALRHLRKAAAVRQLYLYENYIDPYHGLSASLLSTNGSLDPKDDSIVPPRIVYQTSFVRWLKRMEAGKPAYCFKKPSPSFGEKKVESNPGRIAFLAIPVQTAGEWYGFIGFADDKPARNWKKEDVKLLRTAAEILGAYFENKQAEEKIRSLIVEKDLVLKEVHHRVKNNMNMIASLLSLQTENLKNPYAAAALDDASNRLKTMMRIYDSLFRAEHYQTIDFGTYLADLLKDIIAAYPSGRILIGTVLDSVVVSVKVSYSLGLIANELITNALKYAFPVGKVGKLEITLNKSSQKELEMTVRDDGIGIPACINTTDPQSFGLKLVKILVKQFGGTIEIERNLGTRIIFRCPTKHC